MKPSSLHPVGGSAWPHRLGPVVTPGSAWAGPSSRASTNRFGASACNADDLHRPPATRSLYADLFPSLVAEEGSA